MFFERTAIKIKPREVTGRAHKKRALAGLTVTGALLPCRQELPPTCAGWGTKMTMTGRFMRSSTRESGSQEPQREVLPLTKASSSFCLHPPARRRNEETGFFHTKRRQHSDPPIVPGILHGASSGKRQHVTCTLHSGHGGCARPGKRSRRGTLGIKDKK